MYIKVKEWMSLNECVYTRKKQLELEELKKELKMQEVEGGTGGGYFV